MIGLFVSGFDGAPSNPKEHSVRVASRVGVRVRARISVHVP